MDTSPVQVETFIVSDGEGERLDAYLARRVTQLSRSAIARLIGEGSITVSNKPAKANYKVRINDEITVEIPPPAPTDIKAEDIPLEFIYEDADIVVVNKPRGMTTHPAPGSPAGTLVNALLGSIKNLSGVGGVERRGIVHRLDKDTSGLLVVAKNDAAHVGLQAQMQQRSAQRKYLALVWGDTSFEKAIVDAPIGRHPGDRKKMAVVTREGASRKAVTDIEVVERLNGFTLIEASLRTGRTHQIRVHCAHIGHPVVNDPVYGGKRQTPARFSLEEKSVFEQLASVLAGQALHAYKLSFVHPRTGELLNFECPLPNDISALADLIRSANQH